MILIFALEAEAQGRFRDPPPVFSGVGKVNAAYALTRALAEWRRQHGTSPGRVVNLGSAGSPVFPAGTVVACTGFVQRDMDCTALGCAPFVTPFQDGPARIETSLAPPGFPHGICGSGDSFVTTAGDHPWNVIDMEAYALARICQLEQVPFACLKFITDGADGAAADSWAEALPRAADALRAALDRL